MITKNLRIFPKYTETSLFLIGAMFFILLISNSSFAQHLISYIKWDLESAVFLIVIFTGAVFSIIYAFISKKTPKYTKTIMLGFAIVINFMVTLNVFVYLTQSGIKPYLLALPMFNLAYSFLIILALRFDLVTSQNISNVNAKITHMSFGLAILLAIAIFSAIKNLNWAVTYSLGLTYSQLLLDFTIKPIEKILQIK